MASEFGLGLKEGKQLCAKGQVPGLHAAKLHVSAHLVAPPVHATCPCCLSKPHAFATRPRLLPERLLPLPPACTSCPSACWPQLLPKRLLLPPAARLLSPL